MQGTVVVSSYLGGTVHAMGITRFTTKVTLTTSTAKESTGAAVVGRPVWTVAWSVVERGCVSSFRIDDYSEAGARKLVANLLGNVKPGLRVEDVYEEIAPSLES